MIWENTDNELGVEFQQTIKILGITFSNTTGRTMHGNWEQLTRKVKAQAKDAYGRDLCIAQRVRYVQTYLLVTIWCTAQMFPAPVKYTQHLTAAINWYIWQGAIFRVPQLTLQKPKQQGGWALINIAVKCRALLLRRMWNQSKKEGTVTATWLKTWDLVGLQWNPPYAERMPSRISYLRCYALEIAYTAPLRPDEAAAHSKRRRYDTLGNKELSTRRTVEMRVVQKSRRTDWDRVWRNIHESCVSEAVQSTW
jgi:hypothetical protein